MQNSAKAILKSKRWLLPMSLAFPISDDSLRSNVPNIYVCYAYGAQLYMFAVPLVDMVSHFRFCYSALWHYARLQICPGGKMEMIALERWMCSRVERKLGVDPNITMTGLKWINRWYSYVCERSRAHIKTEYSVFEFCSAYVARGGSHLNSNK